MMRVTNVIAVAFFAVLIFNGHYNHDGVGMVAAATLGGGEEEVLDTTNRDTMMTAVVDAESVATRKLTKKSKASKLDADNDNLLMQLLRSLVFDKAMALYSFSMEKSQSSAVGVRRELLEILDGYEEYACNRCLAMFEEGEQYSLDTDEQRDNFCDVVIKQVMSVVSSSMMLYLRTTYNRDNVANYCNELMQCPLRTSKQRWDHLLYQFVTVDGTPTACCQSQGLCQVAPVPPNQDPAYYCKLNDDSGSSENYWIQTESKEKCDSESTALGCGTCKDKGTSHTILDQAGMHDDLEGKITKGFVSYCQGGPRVWREQKTQCLGLTNYPALTTPSGCKDACGGDYTCAVWQFDADGYNDQCWYGTNCDELGDLTWTSGGIRRMGTNQAPDCVQPTIKCGSNYGGGCDPCCGWNGYIPFEYQCSASKPTCDDYALDKNSQYKWSTCGGVRASPTVRCATHFGGSGEPCCDQDGDVVAVEWQCSQSKPICVDYVYNDHWGTCVSYVEIVQ